MLLPALCLHTSPSSMMASNHDIDTIMASGHHLTNLSAKRIG
jgi:hypothetical protein